VSFFSDEQERQLLTTLESESKPLPGSDRRKFLASAIALLGTAAVAKTASASTANLPPQVPQWSKTLGPGVLTNPYGKPSNFESEVIRRTVPWLTADRISSVSMTPLASLSGIITPNSLVFERHHSGVPDIDPEQHRLVIHGLVEKPIILSMHDLQRFPSVTEIKFLECAANGGMEWKGPQMKSLQFSHGMLSCCEWTGVRLSTILAEVGIKPGAKWVLAEGADGAGMARSIPLEKALDDTIIVYAQNGEALRPEQGYPLRLLNPGWEGNTSIKWLRRLKISDKPWYMREETSKYTDLMDDGRARKFSFVQECNSVITSPAPEAPFKGAGWYRIEGFAWSGRGKIKAVDISLDGGNSWQQAELTGLVLSKSLTRFSIMYHWQGNPMLLQSRAVDETGYVQPTITQLRAERGTNSIYHKNSIHTWKLDANGEVSNVQLS